MKKIFGKESLDVKEKDPDWYLSVEQEAKNKNESEQVKIKERNYSVTCSNENSGLTIIEVEAAIDTLSGYSAPNPEEQVFNIMLKKRENQ